MKTFVLVIAMGGLAVCRSSAADFSWNPESSAPAPLALPAASTINPHGGAFDASRADGWTPRPVTSSRETVGPRLSTARAPAQPTFGTGASTAIYQERGYDDDSRRSAWTRLSDSDLLQAIVLTVIGLAGAAAFFVLERRCAALEIGLRRVTGSAKQTPRGSVDITAAARASDGRQAAGLPAVHLSSEVLSEMVERTLRFRQTQPGVEIGYALFGRIVESKSVRRIEITGLAEAGPEAKFSAGHVQFDRDHQQRELDKLQVLDPSLGHIGDAHLHPCGMDVCSSGDLRTDQANVRESATQEMVFFILTDARYSAWSRSSSSSLYSKGLKFDCYYLGYASDYTYARVTPVVTETARVKLSPILDRAVASAPERFKLDFGALRRLGRYALRFEEPGPLGLAESTSLVLTHDSRDLEFILVFGIAADAKPRMLIRRQDQIFEYEPESLNGKWSPQVWFTPLVLEAERELRASESTTDFRAQVGHESQPADAAPREATEGCGREFGAMHREA